MVLEKKKEKKNLKWQSNNHQRIIIVAIIDFSFLLW